MKKYISTIDDGEYPRVLYKYRSWDNIRHKRFITHREVFMASPSQFEDKLDCKIPVRYDLMSKEQAFKFAMKFSKSKNPRFTRQKHRRESKEWVKKKLYKEKELVDDFHKYYFDEYDKRLGIFSLTAESCLDKMWNKYANNHTGFCVGYNTRELFEFLGGGGNVVYVEELPIILPDPIMDQDEIRIKQIYYKEKKWEFEKEYRTQKFWIKGAKKSDRRIKLPIETFNCIIIGKNIQENKKCEIINSIKKNIGNIEIYDHKDVC